MKQRPSDFDPNTPDPKENRCHNCNHDGMNRTGLRAGVPWGAGTMTWVAYDCENNCDHGWIAA